MRMLSKKDLNSAEFGTVQVSKRPTTVVTANGSVETTEDVTVYVPDLDLFVTVQLFDDTPPVLSLGQLCEDHGFSCMCMVSQVPLQVPVRHHDRLDLHHRKKHEATRCAIPYQVHYRNEFEGGGDPLQDLPQWLKKIH